MSEPLVDVAPGDTIEHEGNDHHVIEVRYDELGHARCTTYSFGRLYDFHVRSISEEDA